MKHALKCPLVIAVRALSHGSCFVLFNELHSVIKSHTSFLLLLFLIFGFSFLILKFPTRTEMWESNSSWRSVRSNVTISSSPFHSPCLQKIYFQLIWNFIGFYLHMLNTGLILTWHHTVTKGRKQTSWFISKLLYCWVEVSADRALFLSLDVWLF